MLQNTSSLQNTDPLADASDRLLLETVSERLEAYHSDHQTVVFHRGEVAVVGDRHGAITLGLAGFLPATNAAGQTQHIRVHQDSIVLERVITKNTAQTDTHPLFLPIGEELFKGVKLVLMRLPKSLRELREIADAVARYADETVSIIAVGRVKHMTLQMNDVLREYFLEVRASLAKQKSRILFANTKKLQLEATPKPFPEWGKDADLDFELAAFGATFGGTKFDHGTRLLLKKLIPQFNKRPAFKIVDLGCGNGTVATALARNLKSQNLEPQNLEPQSRAVESAVEIIATDVSWGAKLAAEATVRKAQVADIVTVQRADGCENIPAGWADLIVLNPPFHSGTDVDETLALSLIEAAAKTLKETGEFWLVMNSHLKYRAMLSQAFAEVKQVDKDRRFTVFKATHKIAGK